MKKIILLYIGLAFCLSSFSQIDDNEKIKYRKLTYNDFQKLSINDTSAAVIDLYFNKKDDAIFSQMSLLPITGVFAIIPPLHFIAFGTAFISVPFFIHGGVTLVKYRKKKLYSVLNDYSKTQNLPKGIRKKTNKILRNYEILPINY